LLNCVLFNARSLKNKLSELHHFLYTSHVDCVFITESWLNNNVSDRMLDPSDEFIIYRKDRPDFSGGGVCAIIRKSLNAKRVNVDRLNAYVDILGLDIVYSKSSYRFFIVYRPPDSSRVYESISCRDYMSDVAHCIERNMNTKGSTIIVGDFNCPDMIWDDCSIPLEGISLQLYRFVTANGFVQSVHEPTRGNNLIDLVLTNQPLLIPTLNVAAPFSSSDHNSVNFTIAVDQCIMKQADVSKRTYLWKQGDYSAMAQYLNNYDWSYLISIYLTPDNLWRAFCDVLDEAVDMFIPYVETRKSSANRGVKKKYPPSIRVLSARKRCVWNEMKCNPTSDALRIKYKQLVGEYRTAVKNFECQQEKELIDSKNVGSFYKYVNSRLRNSNASPVLVDSGSFVFTDDNKAEVFNSYFNSVNVDDDGTLPDFPRRAKTNVCLDGVQFTEEKIRRVIRKLKPKSTRDPEGYSPYLVKQLICALPGPLSLLFNSFLSVGRIPSSWRKAIITPIYKKGPSSDPANYRPVSLTSVFGKIMERVIATDMTDYLLTNSLLNTSQHGFLARRSTLTNLLESVNDWTISIENKHQNRVAYIDFSRAFDSVSHAKLLHKLKSYGVDGVLLQWIGDFLSDRVHCTRVGNVLSSFCYIRSGVVQGSCLGPLLFLIYINDITDVFNAQVNCKLYADDVKLYTEVKSADDLFCFQNCLNSLHKWSLVWQLTISSHKCCTIDVGKPAIICDNCQCCLGTELIVVSEHVSDLGITIDKSLSFTEHIAKITRKAHQRASLIHRCFISKNTDLLLKAFITYVRPVLEYNSPIWSPSLIKDITLVESVQRRFTKRIPGLTTMTYCARLKKLNLESLELRRLRADLALVYKIVFGVIRIQSDIFFTVKNRPQLRGHDYVLTKPRCMSRTRQEFFSMRVINLWNNLPAATTDFSSLKKFCSSINKEYLLTFCRMNFM